jgi:tetratricopeptide (TPR) repeat protein
MKGLTALLVLLILVVAFAAPSFGEDSIKKCRKAVKTNPKSADAHNNLGLALYNKGLYDEAIEEFREALKINPDHANTHYNLMNALVKKGLIE